MDSVSTVFKHEKAARPALACEESALRHELIELLATNGLTPVFQPILRPHEGVILGYEGLIRGPEGGPLHQPASLFAVARSAGLDVALEHHCVRAIVRRFAALGLSGYLFVNISPRALAYADEQGLNIGGLLVEAGLTDERLVMELTEQTADDLWDVLQPILSRFRSQGIRFAIDDLGAGSSNLGRWLKLRPEFVKIDKAFSSGIHNDLLRQQILRSVNDIAAVAGTVVIVEGIETQEDFACVGNQGVAGVQGYFIERPAAEPDQDRIQAASMRLAVHNLFVPPHGIEPDLPVDETGGQALQLMRRVPSVSSDTPNEIVFERFRAHPDLHTLPVVDEGVPVGVLTRSVLVERFSLPYQREVYGRKPCRIFMDNEPQVFEMSTPLITLSRSLAEGNRMVSDFLITHHGRYLGIGSSQDLLLALNHMQLHAARYANPLTQLPGNVPIDRQIQRYLASGLPFSVCYADLDNFKPFNDVFGYQLGDEMIRLLGSVLSRHTDVQQDFLGHIGGDDFILLFHSADWRLQCDQMLTEFSDELVRKLADAGLSVSGGYEAEDRQGQCRHYDLPTLSLGAVEVEPGDYESHHQVAQAASEAKSQAKKSQGAVLFIERRHPAVCAA
ncbi:MAG: GGDEF domain-containing protein [Castellaniella sp.]|uniref:GGDEF domain-containing protein n=1 Tax=Castellaniella sp. TaxID=1955812 RepID=UPI0011F874CE|nr:GGDEF domain-containing protein [Castellaniella sp.]TAN26270.1 MAG: GGDEF domain-containing protein [Castellaniella sp.]